MVKTSPSNAGGAGSIPGQGAGIPHASQPINQNIKQKQYCNKFNKDFKNGPHQKILKTKKRPAQWLLWVWLLLFSYFTLPCPASLRKEEKNQVKSEFSPLSLGKTAQKSSQKRGWLASTEAAPSQCLAGARNLGLTVEARKEGRKEGEDPFSVSSYRVDSPTSLYWPHFILVLASLPQLSFPLFMCTGRPWLQHSSALSFPG